MFNWNRKKRKIVKILIVLLCLLLVVFLVSTIYYINEVRIARRDTRKLFASALERYGTELKLSDLSPERKAMLLAIEDPEFYHHHGVDFETPGAGMTTLTQNLVKKLYYPNGFKQGITKIRQTLIAQYALDAIISKDDQLLLFLNICSLGHENYQVIHGYANAARFYFDKDFSAITDDEFLSLVAMHIQPKIFKPETNANTERVQRIKAYLSGQYHPAGVLDYNYNGKQHGTLIEEIFMAIIRLITDAKPD